MGHFEKLIFLKVNLPLLHFQYENHKGATRLKMLLLVRHPLSVSGWWLAPVGPKEDRPGPLRPTPRFSCGLTVTAVCALHLVLQARYPGVFLTEPLLSITKDND